MYYNENFLNEDSLPKQLPENELMECFQKFYEGDIEAKNRIIVHNLRLARWIATQYDNTGIEKEELISLGAIGLIKSVNAFDITKGIKFATYAARVIHNEIRMYLRYNKKFKETSNLEDILNADFDGNELRLKDVVPDEKAEFEDRVINNRFNAKVKQTAKELLTEREYIIISYLYALDGTRKTQKEIAEILNICQSYVSRIEKKALRKLRGIEKQISEVEEYRKNTKGNAVIEESASVEESVEKKMSAKKVEKKSPAKPKENNIIAIHETEEEVDFEIFVNLLKLFPPEEIKLYAKFRNIDLEEQENHPAKIAWGGGCSYPTKQSDYIEIIENDLRKMYECYSLCRKRGINKLDAYEKTKKYIIIHSLRFRYPDYALEELKAAVKKLSNKQQEILYLRYGQDLLSFNEFSKDRKNFFSELSYALKKLEEALEKRSFDIHPKSLRAKLPNYSYEELDGYIKTMRRKYQDILYLRYGEKLDEYHFLSQDKPYYYKLHKRALAALMDIINGKNVGKEQRTIINTYKKEDLLYALPKLSEPNQTAIYLRHGKDLSQNISWKRISVPAGEDKDYYSRKYYNCYSRIDTILKHREKASLNVFIKKVGNYSYEKIQQAILFLPKEEQKVIFLRHGEDLTKYNPWPMNKPYNYYLKLYENAINNLKYILRFGKSPEKLQEQNKSPKKEIPLKTTSQKQKSDSNNRKNPKNILAEVNKEDFLWTIQFLNENQLSILHLRHGEHFDQLLDWPKKVPEGKYKNYYSVTYYNTCNRIKNILGNQKKFIKRTNTPISEMNKTENLGVKKEQLTEEKMNLLKAKLYEELYKKYKTLIDANVLEKMINHIVNIENYQENIDEYQTQIENEILLYLLNIYKENLGAVQSQILLDRIKILFRNKVKKQYKNISMEKIDIAIEEAFISYTGERSFEEELESRIRN